MAIKKNGEPISTLEQWYRLAPPKSPNQWVDGRSAKELARTWLEHNCLPTEVALALEEHTDFGKVRAWTAEPEAKLYFDDFRGEPRNSDLIVYAEDDHGPYLIAVEAKADEPFGDTLADALAAALERHLANDQSRGLLRIQRLAQALLGARRSGDRSLKHIRYQLLTACAGAICEAERRGYARTLVLVHEFVTSRTNDALHRANTTALNNFVRRLSHEAAAEIHPGMIVGPFSVPGSPLFNGASALYLGKVRRNLRDRSGVASTTATSEHGHKTNAFEALCELASKESWCWNLYCTTCGHMHFRQAFSELARGKHPNDDQWLIHRRRSRSATASRFTEIDGDRAKTRVLELCAEADIASIASRCVFPDWLGYLGLVLADLRTTAPEYRSLSLAWTRALRKMTGDRTSVAARLEHVLEDPTEVLTLQDLEVCEQVLMHDARMCRRRER